MSEEGRPSLFRRVLAALGLGRRPPRTGLEPPPNSFVREPRRPRQPASSGAATLEIPEDERPEDDL